MNHSSYFRVASTISDTQSSIEKVYCMHIPDTLSYTDEDLISFIQSHESDMYVMYNPLDGSIRKDIQSTDGVSFDCIAYTSTFFSNIESDFSIETITQASDISTYIYTLNNANFAKVTNQGHIHV